MSSTISLAKERPLPTKATTGLTETQFEELHQLIAEEYTWHSETGRPRSLDLWDALAATLMYFKANVTEEFVAAQFGVSQPSISRIIAEIEPMISAVLEDYIPDLQEALRDSSAVIDGSLLPCWSWKDHPELLSGKHKTTGHNCQAVASLDGRLLHLSDPLPGSMHDAKALDESKIAQYVDINIAIADKGYQGTGPITPVKKPPNGELNDDDKQFNTAINKIRYVIEQAIANFKIWRSLHTDYRRPLATFKTAFKAIRSLIFFTQGFE
jgi:hypothetical protein